MYSLPQEIEVWYLIPTIRREIAKVLVEKYDLTLEEAGKILGVTKAAVSQYLHKKRASEIKIPPALKAEIEKSAEILAKNSNFALAEIQRLLALMKRYGCSCVACKKYNKGILIQCKAGSCAGGKK